MVQSINTKIDLVMKATAFTGLTDYGEIIIGNNGFEFYHSREPGKFIQIPWQEVEYVLASVMLKGKWIPRYAIQTQKNGRFTFASKEPKKVLRAIRNYVDPNCMVHALGVLDVLKRAVNSAGQKKNL